MYYAYCETEWAEQFDALLAPMRCWKLFSLLTSEEIERDKLEPRPKPRFNTFASGIGDDIAEFDDK